MRSFYDILYMIGVIDDIMEPARLIMAGSHYAGAEAVHKKADDL